MIILNRERYNRKVIVKKWITVLLCGLANQIFISHSRVLFHYGPAWLLTYASALVFLSCLRIALVQRQVSLERSCRCRVGTPSSLNCASLLFSHRSTT
jgi:hypothetical protein